MKNNFLFGLALSAAFGASVSIRAEENKTFVVDQNGFMTEVPTNSLDPAKIEEWQIWLFNKNMPKAKAFRWGLILGKSPQDVLNQLRDAQLVEDALDKDNPYRSVTWTWKNFQGPVAFMKQAVQNPLDPEFSKKIKKFRGLTGLIIKGRKDIGTILGKGKSNPFKNTGKVLKDYLKNIEKILKNEAVIRHSLENGLSVTNTIDEQIEEIIQSGEEMKRDAPSLGLGADDNPGDKLFDDLVWRGTVGAEEVEQGFSCKEGEKGRVTLEGWTRHSDGSTVAKTFDVDPNELDLDRVFTSASSLVPFRVTIYGRGVQLTTEEFITVDPGSYREVKQPTITKTSPPQLDLELENENQWKLLLETLKSRARSKEPAPSAPVAQPRPAAPIPKTKTTVAPTPVKPKFPAPRSIVVQPPAPVPVRTPVVNTPPPAPPLTRPPVKATPAAPAPMTRELPDDFGSSDEKKVEKKEEKSQASPSEPTRDLPDEDIR